MATLANADQITAYLTAHGFSAAQIAGVEGNLSIESKGNPDAYNPGENAHGIAQWEGGRWAALQAFAAAHGTATDNVNTQLDFMMSELNGSEHGALTALSAATTPAAAATAFDQKYERSSAASLPARIAAAQSIAAGGITGGAGLAVGNNSAGGVGGAVGGAGFDWNPLNWPKDAMGTLGRYVVDAGLVLIGLVLIVTGVLIMAKGGQDHDENGAPVVLENGQGGKGGKAAGGVKGATEGAADDAAEVAVAA